jgi:hypothetical protein
MKVQMGIEQGAAAVDEDDGAEARLAERRSGIGCLTMPVQWRMPRRKGSADLKSSP